MYMSTDEIREKFLQFFESKGHLRLPSFSLIPKNDKSLLLINAGMAPLKPYFLGIEEPPRRRITTCQKCIRTPDIDKVGKTARHATFFEMLGNFSFGDYFKKEAITWAWEFVTEILKLPKERLWVTIYEEDDEAFEIWHKEVGLEEGRIKRMGKEDNFWEIGTGPCGPCSEIYFDRGVDKGCGKETCGIGCDCDRYVEFWNLVFTQFDKDENGVYHRLKNPNIDTGMGLERIAAIMQGVDSLFDIDIVKAIRDKICEITGCEYGKDSEKDVSIRVITDHIRGTVFMIGDGILPSNEGRGYVLRRLIRRAARHGRMLGKRETFLHLIVDTVIEAYKSPYPELIQKGEYIKKVLYNEESRFNQTIDIGLELLENEIDRLKKNKENVLKGEIAFKLYDTYGFPLDLTREIAAEKGIIVDQAGFDRLMQEQKERARMAQKELENIGWKDINITIEDEVETVFVGYDTLETQSRVLKIFSNDDEVSYAKEGDICYIILDKTPFYAESGGQVADKGVLETEGGVAEVLDVKKGPKGTILHKAKVIKGEIAVDNNIFAKVNKNLRLATMKNHTATHLLHSSLRRILGEHATQSGSLVEPERLRFDFAHFEPLSEEQIVEIEKMVNDIIQQAIPVEKIQTDLDSAIKMGATALFDEKYSNIVRVIKIGDFSMELCGGTHVDNTGQIGMFKIISESSVAAGVRRIEAITGNKVYEFMLNNQKVLKDIRNKLKANSDSEIVAKINQLEERITALEKELEKHKLLLVDNELSLLYNEGLQIGEFRLIINKKETHDTDYIRLLTDRVREKDSKAIVLNLIKQDKKAIVLMACSKEAVKKGIDCGKTVKDVCEVLGGKGGGRPDFAQGGGNKIENLDLAAQRAIELIKSSIEGGS
ncbi:alanyl-tRNA synthetase [Caldicellulosiruptor saccharolyticus DSM 8903]|uniref:Alanine--tRNA ligase n=1 Tax=Caldicellulosiruptor saccharolyticus (strain ATCC 43494 / DSM 8903 / Tp8T 6331) TaxID=351627 RepID=SYA_CALS8|nr:alanine--tRNA ligase [Caldicellulosiruptor saccharolyticus]A4XKP4.1 RecName: Full=Alanine--tRNA ligase; AltName: Full=Alanyl-tRNA synthetase; Short=AlaRS [Caldicellulosiruptor saccharolyticus DSM 8903]ABP67479.1 alanyl-tRNA synthetase [Caldicellulosiruptor saccharolyticus DSM 8903]